VIIYIEEYKRTYYVHDHFAKVMDIETGYVGIYV